MIDKISELKHQIFSRRPVLGEIYETQGRQILADYIVKTWRLPQDKPDALFLAVLKKSLTAIYGHTEADSAVRQLSQKAVISTIDHHGIWNHPFFVNSSLIYSLYFSSKECALVLSTESVSLNNTSSWSGCLLAHDEALNLKRYSFFPDRLKNLPVFSVPAISASNIASCKSRMPAGERFLIESLNLQDILELPSFSLQACQISSRFWQTVFPTAPKLLYFPLESLVLNYLRELFEQDENNFLVKLVFSKEGQKLWQKYFGAEHTFMFWGIDEHGHRKNLSALPAGEELLKSITSRKIYPSSPLCFAVLLTVNLACVGGFTQTTWLTNFKEKFLQLLEEMEVLNVLDTVKDNPTKNFAESDLAFLIRNGKVFKPSAADLYLQKDSGLYQKYQNLAAKITLKQSIESALPEIYKVVIPQKEHKTELLNVGRQAILGNNGLKAIIEAVLKG